MHRHPRRILAIAAALNLALAAAAGPEDYLLKTNGVGKADGIGLYARQAAMADAQESALTALAVSILGADKPDLVQSLVEQSAPFVQSSNVLNHKIENGTTRVTVEFLVNIIQVRNAAVRLLLPSMSYKPRVLVLIADQLDDAGAPTGTAFAEAAMAEACRDVGFEVAATDVIRAAYGPDEFLAAVQHETSGSALLGHDPLADVAIVGIAAAARIATESPTNLKPTKAHLELRVIRADDGRLIDGAAIDAIVHSVEFVEGAKQAIEDACGKLAPQMINAAALSVVGPETTDGFALTIQFPGSRANLETLIATLNQLGADHIHEVFFSEDVARLYFYYPRGLHELIRPLTDRAFPQFRLEQIQTYGRRSLIRLHPSGS